MHSRRPEDSVRSVLHGTSSRRRLLAVGGVVAVGGFAGCLNRVASALTNTGSSPAAAFAGERSEQLSTGEPTVRRLTPTVSGGARGVSGEVELEGWVTSSAVVAANYNNTRSNRSGIASPDSAVTDEELERILAYLDGEAIVAERFTVCLPDAEVPGGNGSIDAAVTPQRLVDYITGRADGDGRVYSWGDTAASNGPGDCDDSGGTSGPGATCGATEHLAAAVSGPTATGGSLEVMHADDGTVVVSNSPPEADGAPAAVRVDADGGSDGPESSTEAIYQAWSGASNGGGNATPEIFETILTQVMVQPPDCPHPFPALLYVGRAEHDGQLVYAGGWVIDDAALYEDSVTMVTMVDAAPVVGIDFGDMDSDGDGIGDAVERATSERGRSVIAGRSRRGARLDAGTVGELVEKGVLTEGGKQGNDSFRRKKPGRKLGTDEEARVTHLALDAPVLHLVNAGDASNEVKFKAGAELSKSVN